MDDIKQMAKTVAQCIKGDTKKTKGYDTAATVKRVDGGTLYVSIPGGVPETPVKKTIDAKVGDTVQVHVGNGTAWLTGNRTAPPTDDAEALVAKAVAKVADKTATKAKTTAEQAQKTANGIKQHFWTDDDGAHITEVTQAEYEDDPDNAGGNLLAQASSVSVREGTKDLAVMSKDGFDAKTYDSSDNEVVIAHLGYGAGTDSGGGTSKAPYYDIGVRLSGSTIGNYSIVEGSANTASGYDAHAEGNVTTASGTGSHCEGSFTTASGSYTHCEGWRTTASGYISHAGGRGTIADQPYQTAIGKYNTDNNTANLFVVGNGTGDNARSNAFEVSSTGGITAGGLPSGLLAEEVVLADNKSVTGNNYGNGNKSVSKTGYTPIGIVGMYLENATSSGTLNTYCMLHSFYLSGTTAYWIVRNFNSGAAKIKVTATILYIKS